MSSTPGPWVPGPLDLGRSAPCGTDDPPPSSPAASAAPGPPLAAALAAPGPAPWEPSRGGGAGGPPASVAVCCGALEGLMLLPSRTILLGAGTGAEREVTPNEFERLAGKGGSKKWRRSIQLADGSGEVGEWLLEHGYERPAAAAGGPRASPEACSSAATPAPAGRAAGRRLPRAASINGSACSGFTAAGGGAAGEADAAAKGALPPAALGPAAAPLLASGPGAAAFGACDEALLPTDSHLHQLVVRQQLRLLQAQRAVLELCQERFANDSSGGGEERARLLADALQMQKQVAQQQQLLHTLLRRRWRRPVGPVAPARPAPAPAPAAAATEGLAELAPRFAGSKHARCAEGPAAACSPDHPCCGSAPAATASLAAVAMVPAAGAMSAAAPAQAPLPGDGSDAVAAMAAHLAGAAPLPPPHLLPFAAPPAVAGRPVDLRALFMAVMSRGGFQAVSAGRRWGEVLAELGLSGPLPDCQQPCGDGDGGRVVLMARLRSVYLDLLLRFERMFDHEAWLRLTGRPSPLAAAAGVGPSAAGPITAAGAAAALVLSTPPPPPPPPLHLHPHAPAWVAGDLAPGPLPWGDEPGAAGCPFEALEPLGELPSDWAAAAAFVCDERPAKRPAGSPRHGAAGPNPAEWAELLCPVAAWEEGRGGGMV